MRSEHQHRRRGTMAPLLLFALTALLGFFALAVNKCWLYSVREDLRTVADAAALAAAQELVNDDMLRGNVQLLPAMLDSATTAAATYSSFNAARSQQVLLRENIDNPRKGDVVFGVLSTPRAGDFLSIPADRTKAHTDQARTNTVVVTARQSRSRGNAPAVLFGPLFGHGYMDVAVLSAVTLDRGIRGFRPRNEPTPLSPLALCSDVLAQNPKSWEYAVEARNGADSHRLDTQTNTYVASSGDGIHEFTVTLPTKTDHLADGNAVLAHFGTADVSELNTFLANGMTVADMAAHGGKFVIPNDGPATMLGQNVVPGSDAMTLYQTLENLRQASKIRIWPLYSDATSSEVAVSGFVAARVVSVSVPENDQPLQFTLKPTMIHRVDAVTDTDLRGKTATMNGNAYICKIRRVE